MLLPEPLAPITQTSSPRLTENEMPSSATSPLPKRWLRSTTSRRANDVALFLDDAFGKIAAQKLADIDADGVAILKRRGALRTGSFADHDRPVGLDHFQRADALVVIAENFQQHVAARAGRKQNVILLEQARVVRNEIFRLRRLELEPAAHGAGAPAQIDQVHLAVVVKNDPVFERRFDLRAGLSISRR